MAFIAYHNQDLVDAADRVPDRDNILRVHALHSRVMRLHYDLYVQLMHRPGPLDRVAREIIGTAISADNGCHY